MSKITEKVKDKLKDAKDTVTGSKDISDESETDMILRNSTKLMTNVSC